MAEARPSAHLKQALVFSEDPTPLGVGTQMVFPLCFAWCGQQSRGQRTRGQATSLSEMQSLSLTPDLLNQRL